MGEGITTTQWTQVRALVSEMTVYRTRDAIKHVASWTASARKLGVLIAIRGLCEMRSTEFGPTQQDCLDFVELARNAGGRAHGARLTLMLRGGNRTDAAIDGHECYAMLLAEPEVLRRLEFPRQAPDVADLSA